MFLSRALFSLLLAQALTVISAAPLNDLVDWLPDYGRPANTMFSGYLNATEGCDTAVNGPYCKIHYWLALADATVLDKDTGLILADDRTPTMLWMNGGPGSSSVLGFLTENGPLLMNAAGGLMENPYSWTKVGHLLVIDSPVGVGYSYCQAQTVEGGYCQNTDHFTASASRAALEDFFTHLFPELAASPFYITGESYAGVYIPTLAEQIIRYSGDKMNLKGLAVGDPCTDNDAQADSMDQLWYGHKYGLVDEAVFDMLWNKCEVRLPNPLFQPNFTATTASGHNIRQSTSQDSATASTTRRRQDHRKLWHNWFESAGPNFVDSPECLLAYRKFLLSSSHGLTQQWKDLYIDDYSLFAPITGKEDADVAIYMRRTDVRKALHVEETPFVSHWPSADVGFDYLKEHDACNDDAGPDARSMIDIYRDVLVPVLDAIWIYNGDTDPCVSYEGTRTAVKRVGLEELDGGSYRPWFYNHTGASMQVLATKAPLFGPDLLIPNLGPQMGGEVVNYQGGLSFLTFHGAGHMVPQFRPQAALHVVYKLLRGLQLAPLLPSNATLQSTSAAGFLTVIDDWTESAMDAPYVMG